MNRCASAGLMAHALDAVPGVRSVAQHVGRAEAGATQSDRTRASTRSTCSRASPAHDRR